ncbi:MULTISPECIES: cobalt ABC transporter permease [unclassified Ruegeria]|uniref:cobalt ABC transporter permease n=1 Tax=unclassified Ruegeria TaxID=2625375 RepID=UPI0014897C24|nr:MULTISPECIES: cobalt ABC transporter permease [unclassified Ruegeria]NOD76971.1 cobalt ABC transporter permease [Ruegeria sp. HKCCD4332]NOD88494.1 cobalt ABC transporter permease [Ruegeria sp. HKCCD4318]NOE13403.1 cobalt ABC transporter permease [Ruegeria sp. HKCCD4318-2]NOG11055.1 cobalt ABC transporter permease [Ruegeria sp. HKCCD4315]
MRHLIFAVAVWLTPLPALAHKVITGVFPAGDAIEGELGFSNGDMAENQEVVVYGPDGAELGRTVTNTDGFFLYTPTEPVAHTFKADLGAGHLAEVTMPAEEVAEILGVDAELVKPATQVENANDAATTVASLTDEERAAIAQAVRDETRPLRREIAAYREHNDLQTVLGGIGYIIGLFGIGFYVAARRKMAA